MQDLRTNEAISNNYPAEFGFEIVRLQTEPISKKPGQACAWYARHPKSEMQLEKKKNRVGLDGCASLAVAL